MKYPRWIFIAGLVLLLVLTTACSCSEKLGGIIGKETPEPTVKPTAIIQQLIIPKTSGTTFEGEMSEEQLEELLNKQITQEAGDYVTSVDVAINTDAIVATVQANVADLNISFGVTVSGVPNIVNGKVYLQVTQVEIDNKLSGWTRLSAKTLVQDMIDNYSGENGIPIEFDGITVEEVRLMPGKLFVRGRTL